MKRTILTLTSLLTLSAALVACTDPKQVATNYAQGQLAFQQKNYATAFGKLLSAAEAGYGNAQYAVGYMLYNGLGVKQNQPQALIWFKKASKQGNYKATAALQKLDEQAERAAYNLPSKTPKKSTQKSKNTSKKSTKALKDEKHSSQQTTQQTKVAQNKKLQPLSMSK